MANSPSVQEWQGACCVLQATEELYLEKLPAVQKISGFLGSTAEYVQETEPKIYSKDWIDLTFWEPYCKISWLVDADIARRQIALGYLHTLKKGQPVA
ncbi:MAG: hypothetical protein V2I45_10350 [Halieaceae bacterium]|jgi:hypothetical protein|nr:hypothetical protein [Halieaceae bacterium]